MDLSTPMSYLDTFSVKGRTALVTGAASGLGLAYAEALAEAGASVTLTDINEAALVQEGQRLLQNGWQVRWAVLDITDRHQTQQVFDDHLHRYGGLDIVFANAGIDTGQGFWNPEGYRNEQGQVDTYDPETWDKSIQVNLTGPYNTIRQAVRCMKSTGKGGSIIVTSSNAAVMCGPIVGLPYMPAKAGLAHMVRQLALELAEFNIRVNAIATGPFVTNIGGGWLKNNPQAREAWDSKVPLGRVAEPKQIKPLALYLASDASDYMTGAHLVIDGGMSLGSIL